MALNDIGMFLPSESQYNTPGAYDALLKGEATKRASYLASMDQFYTQLEESKRQFDETMDFNVESRDLNIELEREKLSTQKELAADQLAFSREELTSNVTLQNRSLDLQERELMLNAPRINLGGDVSEQEQLDFIEDMLTRNDKKDEAPSGPRFRYYTGDNPTEETNYEKYYSY
jgi:hypothetical protein